MRDIAYKKILLTYDGSTLAKKEMPYALSLAHSLCSKILLLQVLESVGQKVSDIVPGVVSSVPIVQESVVESLKNKRKKLKINSQK